MKKDTENSQNMPNAEGRFKLRYIIAFVLSLLFMLAIISYSPDDLESKNVIKNYIGEIGAVISHFSFRAVGFASYVLMIIVMLWGIRSFFWQFSWNRKFYLTGIVLLLLGVTILLGINPEPYAGVTAKYNLGDGNIPAQVIPGGMIGQALAAPGTDEVVPPVSPGFLHKYIGYVGTSIIGYLFLLGGILIIYLSDWHKIALHFIRKQLDGAEKTPEKQKNSSVLAALQTMKERYAEQQQKKEEEKRLAAQAAAAQTPPVVQTPVVQPSLIAENPAETKELSVRNENPATFASAPDPEVNISVRGEKGRKSIFNSEYARPNINMLSKGDETTYEDINEINRKKELLQQTLNSFNVDAYVSGHITGPRITRYEVTLSPGIEVGKITRLESNIAMNLAVKDIRILAPIPGQSAIGVEVPNDKSSAVFARSIMESSAWLESHAAIPIILGKDISGQPVVLDLAKAPHLLIAGQTGSGKSVCMNTLIMSLLFKFSPDDLRLIMVDPKVVEFKDYEKIPHLITPILNDCKKVPLALRWAVNEMERRYRLISDAGYKNVEGFNKRPIIEGEVDRNGEPMPRKLPYIVIIIDELADLMLTEAKVDVETSINRLTAKARAAAIHLVLATQRPSTKVITGNIKTNLPCRIAFKVTSNVDSRVILDKVGADNLLGKGDMLYTPLGSSELERVQGAMVQDEDIKQVVNFISAQRPQEFNDEVLIDENEADEDGVSPLRDNDSRTELDDVMDDIISQEYAPMVHKYSEPGDDELTLRALEIVFSTRQASTSYLQRRLGIGYNRAANLMELFENRGIIGPQTSGGNKRQILVFDEIEGA